jgi:hypothetical protein
MKLTLRAPIMRRCRSCARPHGATLLARIEPVERLSGVFLPSPCPGPRASRPAGRGHGGSGLRAQRRAFVCACVRRWAGRRRAQTRATLLFSPAVLKPLAPPPPPSPATEDGPSPPALAPSREWWWRCRAMLAGRRVCVREARGWGRRQLLDALALLSGKSSPRSEPWKR